ncbi:MAG TPA: carboxylesterase/lipase family protein, partial [Streptomyces sp.]
LSAVAPDRLSAAADALTAKLALSTDRWGRPAHRSIAVAPVVDGDILPRTPWQALAEGRARDIDLLVGHTRDEHRLFALLDGTLGQVTDDQAATALRLFAPGSDGPRRYHTAFPSAGPDELYERVHADWLFRMPSLHLAEAQAAAGGRAHLYELTWPAPGLGGVLGACHGLDVPLIFGNLDKGQPAALLGDATAEAEAVSAQLRTALLSFATHGDPGWPAYTPADPLTRLVDTAPSVAPYPEDASRLLWEDHEFPVLRLLGG